VSGISARFENRWEVRLSVPGGTEELDDRVGGGGWASPRVGTEWLMGWGEGLGAALTSGHSSFIGRTRSR
jgi:hypothetical protein